VTWSESEILALATKAARGAGAPPGQAVRLRQAAVAHLQAGRGETLLIAALGALPGGPILIQPRRIDSALSETDGNEVTVLNPAANPLFASYVDALPFLTSEWVTPEGLVFDINLATPRKRLAPRRITGCNRLIHRMSGLARAILVPKSETSRRDGAGAGLTDND
jgi:hypothetical protein